MNKPTFLGFDLSTQQLKCICLDKDLHVCQQYSVKYDDDLPHYHTNGGVVKDADGRTVTAPVLMWIEAMDCLLTRMKTDNFDFASVTGISGSAQQHGTVYWKTGALQSLRSLTSPSSLLSSIQDHFSVYQSPVWMDASTGKQCKNLEDAVGGPKNLAAITGSRAFERMSGNQIAKIYQNNPDVYKQTERISLVSSFGTSLLIGDYGDIDYSDGSAMNLLDIKSKDWHDACLNACAPGLREKLGRPTAPVVKPISQYYIEKYGFSESCKVVSFTGDNPASLMGMCVSKGECVVSLGTSDTVFLTPSTYAPSQLGVVFINPIDPSLYMALICYKNGSMTRERMKREHADDSWDKFSELLKQTPMGNNGNLGFYFDVLEVQPLVSGVYRFTKDNQLVTSFSPAVEVRAVLESQFLMQRLYAETLDNNFENIDKILATGGASANRDILQVMADVFNKPVYVCDTPNSAAVGAAYRAKHGLLVQESKDMNRPNVISIESKIFDEMTSRHSRPTLIASPTPGCKEAYQEMRARVKFLLEEISSLHG